jgi:hypothetical protein
MLDITNINTPCYIIDEAKLIHNLEILNGVEKTYGCKDSACSESVFVLSYVSADK